MPPLLGWTAATGTIGAGGLVLFGILFLWQVPHFLAISIFRRDEYARAGLKVMPNTRRPARHQAQHRPLFVRPLGGEPPLGSPRRRGARLHGRWPHALGTVFLGWGCWGLREQAGARWARSLFGVSILYLVLLFCALMVGAGPRAL